MLRIRDNSAHFKEKLGISLAKNTTSKYLKVLLKYKYKLRHIIFKN